MINPRFKQIGIAYCYHRKYKAMLVMVYASDFTPAESVDSVRNNFEEVLTDHTSQEPYQSIEQAAFDYQNKIRTDSRRIAQTGGRKVWGDAFYALRRQVKLAAFVWVDGLARAAQDHCNDIGPRVKSQHEGTDGSMPE
jgi:hypothetical protein